MPIQRQRTGGKTAPPPTRHSPTWPDLTDRTADRPGEPAEFSKALYEPFLLRQLPLGRSMLGARNSLLHAYGNPLGIAYAAYADPQHHV